MAAERTNGSGGPQRVNPTLGQVRPVASVRSDPDFQRSALRRLIFVRFDDVPLFWRLDLAVWAESVCRGWERIGVPPAPDGPWADRIAYLARRCAAQEPRLTGFADDIERLARDLLGEQSQSS